MPAYQFLFTVCRADEKQTAIATSCRFLPYAVGLRGNFAGRNSHDICSIMRPIKYKNMRFSQRPSLSPAKGSVTSKGGMPPLEVTEPFAGDNEGLWENLMFLYFMGLMIEQIS